MILAGDATTSAPASAADGGSSAETLKPQAEVSADEASVEAAPETPTVRKIDAPEAEALDLLSVGGGTIAKMALPVLVVAAVVIWFIVK